MGNISPVGLSKLNTQTKFCSGRVYRNCFETSDYYYYYMPLIHERTRDMSREKRTRMCFFRAPYLCVACAMAAAAALSIRILNFSIWLMVACRLQYCSCMCGWKRKLSHTCARFVHLKDMSLIIIGRTMPKRINDGCAGYSEEAYQEKLNLFFIFIIFEHTFLF